MYLVRNVCTPRRRPLRRSRRRPAGRLPRLAQPLRAYLLVSLSGRQLYGGRPRARLPLLQGAGLVYQARHGRYPRLTRGRHGNDGPPSAGSPSWLPRFTHRFIAVPDRAPFVPHLAALAERNATPNTSPSKTCPPRSASRMPRPSGTAGSQARTGLSRGDGALDPA
jgi:hypothetical protein